MQQKYFEEELVRERNGREVLLARKLRANDVIALSEGGLATVTETGQNRVVLNVIEAEGVSKYSVGDQVEMFEDSDPEVLNLRKRIVRNFDGILSSTYAA